MLYGEELHVIDTSNADVAFAAAKDLNTAALGDVLLAKTQWVPGVGVALGDRVVTPLLKGSTTKSVLELFRYPDGLVAGDLATGCAMYNALVVAMNAHAVDLTMHAAVDTNFSTILTPQAPVSTLAGLIAGVNLLETAYIAHNTDSQQGSPAFHVATGVNHALASAATATTLATALTQLNDILAKYNLHELGLTMHYVANLHPGYKVSLGTISQVVGDAVGKVYQAKVPNKVIDQVPVQPGKAQYNAGDQLVIQCTQIAVGGTSSGTFQPFIIYSNRGESIDNQPVLVDRTPAIVGI